MAEDDIKPKKLIVHVADDDIADLKQRLSRTRYHFACSDPLIHLSVQPFWDPTSPDHGHYLQAFGIAEMSIELKRSHNGDLVALMIRQGILGLYRRMKSLCHLCRLQELKVLLCRWPDELEGVGWEYGAKKSYVQVCPSS